MNTQKNQQVLSFDQFAAVFRKLEGQKLNHVDLYYQKLDLHFGNYHLSEGQMAGDLVLYVSGFWTIRKNGQKLIDESNSSVEIKSFFEHHIGLVVNEVFFDKNDKVFKMKFSSEIELSVLSDDDYRSVELMEADGTLTSSSSNGDFFQINRRKNPPV